MGISSNQARFLSLTARQVDLEQRVQQICQRRLRLSSELENVATSYNNQIGNRKMFTYNTTNGGISQLSISGIESMKDSNGNNYRLLGNDPPLPDLWYSKSVAFQRNKYDDPPNSDTTTAFSFGHGDEGYHIVKKSDLGLSDSASEAECVEVALRLGILIIGKDSDEFTQQRVYLDGFASSDEEPWNTELCDWRTIPQIADELYKGDDVDAENKYDRIISEINSQDKKLQLEQASVEVEYKAITSEKEAVKKILDTNASTSFKYFG